MNYRLEHQLRRNDFLQLLLDARLQEKTNNNEKNNSKIKQNKASAHHRCEESNGSSANATTGAKPPRAKLVDGQRGQSFVQDSIFAENSQGMQNQADSSSQKPTDATEPGMVSRNFWSQYDFS
jgi:hypothetical protein